MRHTGRKKSAIYVGVAQLVECQFWELDAAGSSPVTRTRGIAEMKTYYKVSKSIYSVNIQEEIESLLDSSPDKLSSFKSSTFLVELFFFEKNKKILYNNNRKDKKSEYIN